MLLGSFLCSRTFSLIYSHLLSFPFPLLDCVFCLLPSSSTPQPCGARGLTQFCLAYVCVCVSTHACMDVYMRVHDCAHVCTCACMCVHSVHLRECMHVCACTLSARARVGACTLCAFARVRVCVCVCMCIRIRVCPLCGHGLRAVPGSRWCSRLWVMSSFIFPSGGTTGP